MAMKPGSMPKMPKPSQEAKAAFLELLPGDPGVTTRPMFGNLSAFVNGNMFAGVFGDDLFVRLSDDEQKRVRSEGGRAFEPMAGHAMKGYVIVGGGWQESREAKDWVNRSLEFAKHLPPKQPKSKKKK